MWYVAASFFFAVSSHTSVVLKSGVRAIAKGLAYTRELRELNLASNLITDHGCMALAEALVDPASRLTFLNLSGNMVGNTGADMLGVSLEANPSLVKICLDSNFIGLQGKDALADGMAKNRSGAVEFISLAGNVRSGILRKLTTGDVERVVWNT